MFLELEQSGRNGSKSPEICPIFGGIGKIFGGIFGGVGGKSSGETGRILKFLRKKWQRD
jgi:hypothetical protein